MNSQIYKYERIILVLFVVFVLADQIVHLTDFKVLAGINRFFLFTSFIAYHLIYIKKNRLELNKILLSSHFFAFLAICLSVSLPINDSWVAFVQIALLIESQLLISALRSDKTSINFRKVGIFPISLTILVSTIFIYLCFQDNSLAINGLLLYRIVQTCILSWYAFLYLNKSKTLFLGIFLLALSNFTSGTEYFIGGIPFEYFFTIGSFYLGRLIIVKGFYKLNYLKISNYINQYHLK